MNELEAWKQIENLYEKCGVSHTPSYNQHCLLTSVHTVAKHSPLYDVKLSQLLLTRLDAATSGRITHYNDTHTKEENLAIIHQCRTECAAEFAAEETQKRRDLGVPGSGDKVHDHLSGGRQSRSCIPIG